MFEFYIVLIACFLIFIYILYFKINCNKNLHVNVEFNIDRVNVDGECELIVSIENKKLLFVPVICITLNIDKNIVVASSKDVIEAYDVNDYYSYKISTTLLAYQKAVKKIRFKPKKRGKYNVEGTYLLSDYLGFVKKEFKLKKEASIIVHPTVANINNIIDQSTSIHGEVFVKRWLYPDNIFYSGVRPYTQQDTFKDIDWIASAKLSNLCVKKYDYTASPSIMVYLDVYSSIETVESNNNYIEEGIKVAASIVDTAFKNRVPIGFCTNANVEIFNNNLIEANIGRNNTINIFDMMSFVLPKCDFTIKDFFEKYYSSVSDTNTVVFIKYKFTSYTKYIIEKLLSQEKKVIIMLFEKCNVGINNNNCTTLFIGGDLQNEVC